MKTLVLLASASAIVLTTQAAAQTEDHFRTTQVASDVKLRAELKKLEFAGIYWGAPMGDLASALTARGYKVELVQGEPPNFYEEVLQATKEGSARRTSMFVEAKRDREQLRIELQAFPGGPRVTSAVYTSGPHMNALTFMREKLAKSGLIFKGDDASGYFCLREERNCGDTFQMPYLYVVPGGITLSGGNLGKETYEKVFDDTVKVYVGKRRPTL